MAKNGRTTLNEIMGKSGDKKHISLDDLPNLLGEKMPKLEYHPLGRIRLIRALSQRFGPGWRNLPGMHEIMNEFEKNSEHERVIHQIKQIKPKRD